MNKVRASLAALGAVAGAAVGVAAGVPGASVAGAQEAETAWPLPDVGVGPQMEEVDRIVDRVLAQAEAQVPETDTLVPEAEAPKTEEELDEEEEEDARELEKARVILDVLFGDDGLLDESRSTDATSATDATDAAGSAEVGKAGAVGDAGRDAVVIDSATTQDGGVVSELGEVLTRRLGGNDLRFGVERRIALPF